MSNNTVTKSIKPNGAITWKQMGVIISIILLLALGFGYTNTKADKKELDKLEARVEKKIDKLILKQDKIYDLLIGR